MKRKINKEIELKMFEDYIAIEHNGKCMGCAGFAQLDSGKTPVHLFDKAKYSIEYYGLGCSLYSYFEIFEEVPEEKVWVDVTHECEFLSAGGGIIVINKPLSATGFRAIAHVITREHDGALTWIMGSPEDFKILHGYREPICVFEKMEV